MNFSKIRGIFWPSVTLLQFALFSLVVALAAQIFHFPMVMEARESTDWLYVLTFKMGINIYDTTRVAYSNFSHGPVDSLVKYAISSFLPFLEPWQVLRFFVLLLPFTFLGMCFIALDDIKGWMRLALSLTAASAIFYVSNQYAKLWIFVGRSDATALFFLALFLANFYRSTKVRRPALDYLSGLWAFGCFFTNWRYGPVLLVAALAIQVHQRPKDAIRSISRLLPVFVGLFTLFVAFFFGGSFRMYFHRFFGFFSDKSGFGHGPTPKFELLPSNLRESLGPLLLILIMLVGLTLWSIAKKSKTRALLSGGVLAIGALFAAATYHRQGGGGGIYYYNPYLVWIVFWISTNLRLQTKAFHALAGFLAIGAFFLLDKSWMLNQVRSFTDNRQPALAHLLQLRELHEREGVHSEIFYLYQNRYANQLIDSGDFVELFWRFGKLNQARYYGENFNITAGRYYDGLEAHPPKYVYALIAGSGTLRNLLEKQYREILRSPVVVPLGELPGILYERVQP